MAGTEAVPLLTSREVATMLRVSEGTLSRWRARKAGPAWLELSAGMPRYEAADVARFMENSRHDGK